jgi:uncharacterized protein
MLSLDTNILFYALNSDAPQHARALKFLESLQSNEDVALSELMLAELYRLLRNPVVVSQPMDARGATAVIQQFRRHPRWRLLGFPPESRALHDRLWEIAGKRDFAYRRLYDARMALMLLQHGVTQFATVNTKDFTGLGFERVWNPLG